MRPATITSSTARDASPAGVLAVDDLPTFRKVVRELVSATPGMVVVGEAASGEEAVALVEQLEPDLVLMDVRMPGMGGVRAARKIKDAHPAIIVALLSTTNPDELGSAGAECRADALIWKGELQPHLLLELWQRHQAA
jgi:DNA-binding NarL/FixJ family response regulator